MNGVSYNVEESAVFLEGVGCSKEGSGARNLASDPCTDMVKAQLKTVLLVAPDSSTLFLLAAPIPSRETQRLKLVKRKLKRPNVPSVSNPTSVNCQPLQQLCFCIKFAVCENGTQMLFCGWCVAT